jgi:hypothetical protein
MYFMGEGRGPEQMAEIRNMNGGYVAIRKMKERLQSNDMTAARANIHEIQALETFIDKNLPALTERPRSSSQGFYSPAHMMRNATRFVESAISSGEISKAMTADDQAMRLMAYGEKSTPGVGGRTELSPNLVEIPEGWRRSDDGEKFLRRLESFVTGRKQNRPISELDFELLDGMSSLVAKSYEGMKAADKQRMETAPRARELIWVNLQLLSAEAKKYRGTQMPATQDNLDTIQLIRGLFNYTERAGAKPSELPEVIGQPRILKT